MSGKFIRKSSTTVAFPRMKEARGPRSIVATGAIAKRAPSRARRAAALSSLMAHVVHAFVSIAKELQKIKRGGIPAGIH
jgi:hypothetical protein